MYKLSNTEAEQAVIFLTRMKKMLEPLSRTPRDANEIRMIGLLVKKITARKELSTIKTKVYEYDAHMV